jgi:NAD(P)-dependent dehydrogenase (short-subunit alcohol dehydrogenase family)
MGPGTGRLQGRRVLITGAASGVGKATAERFVREGAKVALVDINAAALAEVSAALSAPHFAADVADEADVRAAVAGAAEALGGLDGVANVAGMAISRPLASTTVEEWNRTLAVNLTAAFLVSREALPHLEACEGATIVNVSSASGLMPLAKGLGPYAASKAGLITLSKALAFELAPRIRVNVVCPGAIDTPMLLDPIRVLARDPERSPYALRRTADPAEIADAILYLTGRESSYVTGAALAVDGGRSFH